MRRTPVECRNVLVLAAGGSFLRRGGRPWGGVVRRLGREVEQRIPRPTSLIEALVLDSETLGEPA